MNNSLRVRFEYSVDEAVAFQIGSLRATKEGASWRSREQLKFLVSLIAAVVVLGWMSSDRSPEAIVGIAGIALLIVPIATALFGVYYDHVVKNRLRRVMIEQLGGTGPHTCTIEIRLDGLWVSQPTVEITFPWRDAKNIEDTAEGVSVFFVGGRVLARTRGFSSQGHRDEFVAGLRKHISAASSASSAA